MYGPSVDSQFPFVLCVLSVLFLDSLKFQFQPHAWEKVLLTF